MSTASADGRQDIPDSLDRFAALLEGTEHRLATGGDADLANGALEATKDIFDLAMSLEPKSHPHLHPFLASIMEPPTIQLRSSKEKPVEEKPAPEDILPYTPLSVLTVDGMDPEQVWAQLELRNEGICRVVKEVGSTEEADEDDEGSENGEDDEEDEDDMTYEEWKEMMLNQGIPEDLIASEEDFNAEKGIGSDEDEDSEEGSELDDEDEDDLDDEEGSSIGMGSEDEEMDENDEDEEDEDEEDEDEGSDEDEDDESTVNPDVDMDDEEDDLYAAGPSKPRKKAKHPTLDDQFFSIDDFNRMTEEQEASHVSSGRLGGDEEEEAEMDDFGAMFLEEGDDEAPLMYADFFEAPARSGPPPKRDETSKKGKKGKKSARFADEEDEEVEEDEEDEVEESRDVMSRVKGDLFDDSDDEGDEAKVLSTHERRQKELAEQIAQLEEEAIGPKDWTLLGEATARARPENSLLEENLDFEQVAKVVPVITEEVVASLEDLIKKRILDNNFDSPVRVRAYEPTPFLPSRFFELQDTQSTKSLAQIYEDDYQAAASGTKAVDVRDEKLRKEHEEIDRLWGEICYKLDALSSLNFVPKAPKAQIQTIENIATTSLESALPSTQSTTSMLAPHELFSGPSATELQARSEQTPEEARAARGKARKAKKAERARLGAAAELYGKKKQSVKQQKEDALKGLVAQGKGQVTVLGKGASEDAKRRRRDQASAGESDAKRLKL